MASTVDRHPKKPQRPGLLRVDVLVAARYERNSPAGQGIRRSLGFTLRLALALLAAADCVAGNLGGTVDLINKQLAKINNKL